MTKTSFTHKIGECTHGTRVDRGEGKAAHMNRWLMWSHRRQARACDLGSNGHWPAVARDWRRCCSWSAAVCALVIFIYPFICFGCLSFILFLIYLTIFYIFMSYIESYDELKTSFEYFDLRKSFLQTPRTPESSLSTRKSRLKAISVESSREKLSIGAKDMENYELKRSNDHV